MINLYWPIYKSLEKEVIELSNQIHFDDQQLTIYSVKISELLIRCSVEIEAISKELYSKLGGSKTSNDLFFDTDCLQLLEEKWIISKKTIIISAPNFYFQDDNNRILTPLLDSNRRSKCDWKKAYQAVKHNRSASLTKGNIKNLLRALGALFILNVYYKNEEYDLKRDSNATTFPTNLGSDIFSIKLHKWVSYDGQYNYKKNQDFDECIYITKNTENSVEEFKEATKEMYNKQQILFNNHQKFIDYKTTNKLENYTGQNIMLDILGYDDYYEIIRISGKELKEIYLKSEYHAVLNKNNIE